MITRQGEIDFVITWVDGNDPEWIKEKERYRGDRHTDSRVQRFRDWDNLMYWFRSVEKFAPWVNKIHFVTWGHLPKWLNTEHPKLNIVKHSDFIPEKYLPTFSSRTIELNLHRIFRLAENFVYFNDDMFIIAPVKQDVFFKNDLPCDSAVLNVHCPPPPPYEVQHAAFNDIGLVNKYFDMKTVIKANPSQWFNLKYGKELLRTLALLSCPRFPGMWQHHLPTSFNRSTFEEVWANEHDELNETCMHRFRYVYGYNQWLFREWQIAKGEFYPRSINVGKSFFLGTDTAGKSFMHGDVENLHVLCEYISKQKGKIVCINDGELSDSEFENKKETIKKAFHEILPEKSKFEV